MKNYFLISLLFIFIISCKEENKLAVDVSNINAEVTFKRFEQVFYGSNELDLKKIKAEYPYFFSHDVDSIWIKKMKDTDEQELYKETQKVYPNLKLEKEQLKDLFKHIKYYYPKFVEPSKVVTLNSNVSFEQRVVYMDSLLLISLDVFLGKDSKIYEDYPDYIKEQFTKEHLIVSVAEQLVRPIVFPSKDRSFLARMIQQGKIKYALDAFLPTITNAIKNGYSKEKQNWVEGNEAMIWQFFMENKLLYDTSKELNKRFIDFAPFSKFYLDIDNQSPGSVGSFIGLQIVKAFMKHNDVSLPDLMIMENETIFKKSKYKPRR
ncbi:MAG: gliding motility lipoprotein GldB [Flavobacteriaceae bacterium]